MPRDTEGLPVTSERWFLAYLYRLSGLIHAVPDQEYEDRTQAERALAAQDDDPNRRYFLLPARCLDGWR